MTSQRWIIAIVLILTACAGRAALGQVSESGLLAPNVIRRHGLDRMWHTQIEVDRGQGQVLFVVPHLNATRSTTLFEVTFQNRRVLISEYDRDAFGERLGVEGAKARAEEQVAEFKTLYPNVKAAATYEMIVSPEVTLYASTNRGVLHAIDGETGRTRWVVNVGNPNYPMTEPAANDEFVTILNGSTLYVIRSSDGQFEWQRRVDGVPAAGPAMSDQYVFAPMISGAMESYQLDSPKNPPWIYKSLGRAVTQPATGLGCLAWPTDRGHLYVAATTNRAIRYRMEAKDTILSTPVFVAPDKLIATSIDGYIYCLAPLRQSSNMTWQFSTGEPISQSPTVIGDVAYVVSDSKRLYAMSVKDGLPLWDSPAAGIKRVLSVSKDRLYVFGDVGHLLMLDVSTGARVGDIPTIEYDLNVKNLINDRLYIGSRNGTIQCLREINHRWPLFHQAVVAGAKPKPKPSAKPKQDGDAEPSDDPFAAPGGKPKMEAGDDPFAPAGGKPKADAEDDPFGGPAAKPGAKPKPADDPFG